MWFQSMAAKQKRGPRPLGGRGQVFNCARNGRYPYGGRRTAAVSDALRLNCGSIWQTVMRSTKVLFTNGTPSARNGANGGAFSTLVAPGDCQPGAPVAPAAQPTPPSHDGRCHTGLRPTPMPSERENL